MIDRGRQPRPLPSQENTTMKTNEVLKALAAPFATDEIRWKAQAVKGDRALAVAYIDARAVMDRLDEVCGLNWSDGFDVLPNGSVVCRLQVTIDGQTIVKTDVGSPSDQPDEGDKVKAAFSDALKRAAIKFGVGRYLYRLPKLWIAYDAPKKALMSQPQLPQWALPATNSVDTAQPISETHAKELQARLAAAPRIDARKFLAAFGAGRLTEIPRGRLADARALIANPTDRVLRNGK
jgi:hypothetical protein